MSYKTLTTAAFGIMLIAAWLAGCGGSGSEPTTQRSESQQHLKKLKIENVRPAKGRSFCDKADVKLGRTPGVVDFAARCVGLTKGGPIDVVVTLDPIGGVSHEAKINWYRHSSRVSGAKPGSYEGRCSLNQQALECGAKAIGRVEIAGRFAISPAAECSMKVSIVNITVAACHGNNCESGPVLDQLFSRRPRGC